MAISNLSVFLVIMHPNLETGALKVFTVLQKNASVVS